MANRQRGFGMTAELNRKREAKFDVALANDCMEWMKLVLIDGGFAEDAEKLTVCPYLTNIFGSRKHVKPKSF